MEGSPQPHQQGSTSTAFYPSTDMHVYFVKAEEVANAEEQGLRPVSARFYVERNAPDSVKTTDSR